MPFRSSFYQDMMIQTINNNVCLALILLTLLLSLAKAQSNSVNCNSACINYLTALANEKNIVNAAVWDYSGPVNAKQIHDVCVLANPLSCCDCGGTGISDSNQKFVLAAWAVTCNTFNQVQDGGASAVTCWTSRFTRGCVDYDNLLEGGSCGAGGGNGGTLLTSSSSRISSTTRSAFSSTSSSSSSISQTAANTSPTPVISNGNKAVMPKWLECQIKAGIGLILAIL